MGQSKQELLQAGLQVDAVVQRYGLFQFSLHVPHVLAGVYVYGFHKGELF